MTLMFVSLIAVLVYGGATTLSYDFLPSSALTYFSPDTVVDLKGRTFSIHITTPKEERTSVDCSKEQVQPRHLFVGPKITEFAEQYLKALILACNGKVNGEASDTISVDLRLLAAKSIGFVFNMTYGYCQLHVRAGALDRDYCIELDEKDPRSPLGVGSVVWSKDDARRQMASGSLKVLYTKLLMDIAKAEKGVGTKD